MGDPGQWTLRILNAIESYDQIREWLDDLCEHERNTRLRSYAGFLGDATRYAKHVRDQPEKYPPWNGQQFDCGICRDDPDGTVLVGDFTSGTLQWCTCARACGVRSERGNDWLEKCRAEHEANVRELETSVQAKLEPFLKSKRFRHVNSPPKRQCDAELRANRIVESVICSRCGESVTRFADGRIQSCFCRGCRSLERATTNEMATLT